MTFASTRKAFEVGEIAAVAVPGAVAAAGLPAALALRAGFGLQRRRNAG